MQPTTRYGRIASLKIHKDLQTHTNLTSLIDMSKDSPYKPGGELSKDSPYKPGENPSGEKMKSYCPALSITEARSDDL